MEKEQLDQIREEALDLQFMCQQYEQFDPSVMLKEVHHLAEVLCKLRSGKFSDELIGITSSSSSFAQASVNTNGAIEDEYPDWDHDYFKAGKSKKKSFKKKGGASYVLETEDALFGEANTNTTVNSEFNQIPITTTTHTSFKKRGGKKRR